MSDQLFQYYEQRGAQVAPNYRGREQRGINVGPYIPTTIGSAAHRLNLDPSKITEAEGALKNARLNVGLQAVTGIAQFAIGMYQMDQDTKGQQAFNESVVAMGAKVNESIFNNREYGSWATTYETIYNEELGMRTEGMGTLAKRKYEALMSDYYTKNAISIGQQATERTVAAHSQVIQATLDAAVKVADYDTIDRLLNDEDGEAVGVVYTPGQAKILKDELFRATRKEEVRQTMSGLVTQLVSTAEDPGDFSEQVLAIKATLTAKNADGTFTYFADGKAELTGEDRAALAQWFDQQANQHVSQFTRSYNFNQAKNFQTAMTISAKAISDPENNPLFTEADIVAAKNSRYGLRAVDEANLYSRLSVYQEMGRTESSFYSKESNPHVVWRLEKLRKAGRWADMNAYLEKNFQFLRESDAMRYFRQDIHDTPQVTEIRKYLDLKFDREAMGILGPAANEIGRIAVDLYIEGVATGSITLPGEGPIPYDPETFGKLISGWMELEALEKLGVSVSGLASAEMTVSESHNFTRNLARDTVDTMDIWVYMLGSGSASVSRQLNPGTAQLLNERLATDYQNNVMSGRLRRGGAVAIPKWDEELKTMYVKVGDQLYYPDLVTNLSYGELMAKGTIAIQTSGDVRARRGDAAIDWVPRDQWAAMNRTEDVGIELGEYVPHLSGWWDGSGVVTFAENPGLFQVSSTGEVSLITESGNFIRIVGTLDMVADKIPDTQVAPADIDVPTTRIGGPPLSPVVQGKNYIGQDAYGAIWESGLSGSERSAEFAKWMADPVIIAEAKSGSANGDFWYAYGQAVWNAFGDGTIAGAQAQERLKYAHSIVVLLEEAGIYTSSYTSVRDAAKGNMLDPLPSLEEAYRFINAFYATPQEQ